MIERICARCGSLPLSCVCPPRWREKDAKRPSSHKRGYTPKHRETRKREARRVNAGGVLCARCQRPIVPGTPWDLGHSDVDRSVYTGPEHSACNRATSTHRAARA